ncbi:GspE/PulE family protein [Vibrio coralliilyticus]|uniref:GspE/PulE family protein n=1 Tax=Vibrio coralliilyticus TaxID=190893 RepID=UPI00211F3DD6|nr:ATPase, T2SS/T4P/T4SS family [Vibrio coralliilyticus]
MQVMTGNVVQTDGLKSIYFQYQDTVLMSNGEIRTSNYDSEAIPKIQALLASDTSILPTLNGLSPRVYKESANTINTYVTEVSSSSEIIQSDIEKQSETGARTKSMLQLAVDRGVSDIHIEIYKSHTEINSREDGKMVALQKAVPEKEFGLLVVGWLFNEAEIKEADFYANKPNNGRVEIDLNTNDGKRTCQWRISYIPAKDGGGQLTMRWLNKDLTIPNFYQLGWEPGHIRAMEDFINSASGMCIVTGQVGSGKSTTIASALSAMKGTGRAINTLEDPVEFDIGVIQTSVSTGDGDDNPMFDYAKLLLRHDPDVESHGEVRENKGAMVACRKADTGQIMFTTMHTSSAIGVAVTLHEQFHVPLSVISAGKLMKLWIYQTLVRKLCPHCSLDREEAIAGLSATQIDKLTQWEEEQIWNEKSLDNVRFRNPDGCSHCKEGEKHRTSLIEMLVLDDEDRKYIFKQDEAGWKEALQRKGFKDVQSHANLKILRGEIDLFTTSQKVDGLISIETGRIYSDLFEEE